MIRSSSYFTLNIDGYPRSWKSKEYEGSRVKSSSNALGPFNYKELQFQFPDVFQFTKLRITEL